MNTCTPLVSVCCITYNHEQYIRKTIEGFLIQKTTFSIEIIIHDDASTDNTPKIIQEYEQKYPGLFVCIYQKENQYSKGICPFATYINFVWPKAQGKYIALCEGDDYWTDPCKLQKQVDFLEQNKEYAGAAHESKFTFENEGNQKGELFGEHKLTIIGINDLIEKRQFSTPSFIFRTKLIKKFTLPTNIYSSDYALFFLVGSSGKIAYSNEVMCVYRKHNNSISATPMTLEQRESDLNIIPWISKINPEFPKHKYAQILHLNILFNPDSITIKKIFKHYFLYIYHSFYIFPKNIAKIISFTFKLLPGILKK